MISAGVRALRAPAPPAHLRIARLGRTGPSPWPSCGSLPPDCSPRTHGAQPVAVLRLALHAGGRFGRGRSPPPSLVPHHETAVDVEGLSRHVVGVGAGEKRHDAGDVLGTLGATE